MANGIKFERGVSGGTITIPSSSVIELDLSRGNNFTINLTEDTYLDVPINIEAGQSGRLIFRHDGTHNISYANEWKWQYGYAPNLTSAVYFDMSQVSALDMLVFETLSDTEIVVQMIEDMKTAT